MIGESVDITDKAINLFIKHGWAGGLVFFFIFVLFVLFIVKYQNTLFYSMFSSLTPEKRIQKKRRYLKRIAVNSIVSDEIRELAKHDEIRLINKGYLKCDLDVDSQLAWARLINFHRNKNISREIYRRSYSVFEVKDSILSSSVSRATLVRIWAITTFQFIIMFFIVTLGIISTILSSGIGGEANMKLAIFYLAYSLFFMVFLVYFSMGTPNFMSYRKVKPLIDEYNQRISVS